METWTFHYENANVRGTGSITVPYRSSIAFVKAELAVRFPGCSISRLNCLGDDE